MDTVILYVIAGVGLLASLLKDRGKTVKALKKAWKAFEGILPQLLVVLILVAVTLAVLDTATIARYLGSGSGPLGVIIAALVGAITLIPGFVAFPAAAALLNAGAGATQIAAFVSSLMMVGVVTLPMEMKYFGRRAALLRNGFAFIFSFVAAIFVGWVVGL
ncbi:MAG: permease [Spirochaetales bacterium]